MWLFCLVLLSRQLQTTFSFNWGQYILKVNVYFNQYGTDYVDDHFCVANSLGDFGKKNQGTNASVHENTGYYDFTDTLAFSHIL
jgi:hypothetical protein